MKFLKIVGAVLAVVFISLVGLAIFNWDKIERLQATVTLFDEDKIVHNFSHMDEAFEYIPFKKGSDATFEFGSAPAPLPKSFVYMDETKDTREFLTRRATTALVVIKDDKITFEDYYLGTTENDKRISWSMNKSVVSALFGIYVEKGLIDIEKPVTDYVPMLVGSGYDGVKVKHVLQMSSGVSWNEDYSDFDSDINRMGRALSLGGSLDEVAASVKPGWEPGTKFFYASMDTHVLGMVLRSASGKSLPYLLEKHVWSEIQPEANGYWLTDGQGTAFALGGLNVRTRDYARFGRLFLNNGNWNGKQIIPENWVKASTTYDGVHVTPGPETFGYGYQWWLAPNARPGEYFAVGVYGQYIYINQPENILIVKNSADRGFMDEIGSMAESMEFFRSITDSLSSHIIQ